MDEIDIGLFDYDRHNTIYFFILNGDERIYLRYGGRDAESADTYLNLRSLELSLEQGLRLHEQYERGELPPVDRPQPLYPRDFSLLYEQTIKSRRCVECHLIADFQAQQWEQEGTLDRLSVMYRSPDIKRLGIQLDVPKGLVVRESHGAAAAAGIRDGDRISSIQGRPVLTFGDLQYEYGRLPRDATSLALSVVRGTASVDLTVELPSLWWYSDLDYRFWSVEPILYYKSRPLSDEEKREERLDLECFASRVTSVHPAAELLNRHELQVGDIIVAVNGVDRDKFANSPLLYVKLHTQAGATVELTVRRNGHEFLMPLKTGRQRFRK